MKEVDPKLKARVDALWKKRREENEVEPPPLEDMLTEGATAVINILCGCQDQWQSATDMVSELPASVQERVHVVSALHEGLHEDRFDYEYGALLAVMAFVHYSEKAIGLVEELDEHAATRKAEARELIQRER